ncbi:hypothetical protein EYR38_004433 [Pleurotus pulmonarius]|nr:hypothetical protein EYR38_004433 [Pleurotus pulmonarius]
MANTTVTGAKAIHGQNPQFLVENVIRNRIYESSYWKEYCFALTAETLIDKAIEIKFIGGVYGNQRPTEFLCLLLKLLQIQPEKEILIEYLQAEEFKYLRALAALYVRMTFSAVDVYEILEPLLKDYRKLRNRNMAGYSLTFMDEFVYSLLTEERVCDIILPRLQKRSVLEERGDIGPRKSRLLDAMEGKSDAGRVEALAMLEGEVPVGAEVAVEATKLLQKLVQDTCRVAPPVHGPVHGHRIDPVAVVYHPTEWTNPECSVVFFDSYVPSSVAERLTEHSLLTMMVAATRLPVIAICGTTGVGKSQLAVEIALHLSKITPNRARIINADAMQCYAGMDIITNKMPEAQRQGVEHLLMGFKQPGEQYVVGQWVQDSVKAIEETHKLNKIPVVVGGTSYWIQHLLFPNRLSQSGLRIHDETPEMSEEVAHSLTSLPPELLDLFNTLPEHPPSASDDPKLALSLHRLLSSLDPKMAIRWHWRDTRKVLRNIEIVKETGRIPSSIVGEQSKETARPRYRTLCYWLYADPEVLNPRLDTRIDEMIEAGLLDEIKEMRHIAIAGPTGETSNEDTDYTLGYKEFHEYLTTPNPPDNLFHESVNSMKHSTRKYAKRQISWLRNKLLPVVNEANTEDFLTPTYVLDATGESQRAPQSYYSWLTSV